MHFAVGGGDFDVDADDFFFLVVFSGAAELSLFLYIHSTHTDPTYDF